MHAMTMMLILCMTAGAASAKPHLRNVREIDGLLVQVRVADKIRKKCDRISGRMLKANGLVYGLKSKARKMGYSRGEIDAYINSDADHDRQRGLRDEYMFARGVQKGVPETYCALGKVEIEKGGQIGALLRMN